MIYGEVSMEVECPQCGSKYEGKNGGLTLHWRRSSTCTYPELSDRQKDIIRGCLLGDGCISSIRDDGNPMFEYECLEKDFVVWLREQFGEVLFGDVTSRERNGKPVYRVRSRRLPDIEDIYHEFYTEGEKYFPEDLDTSPLVMKLWYVGDGSFHERQGNRKSRIEISAQEQLLNHGRTEYIQGLFTDLGFNPTFDSKKKPKTVRIPLDERQEFFDYIGDPLPGYNNKWPYVTA